MLLKSLRTATVKKACRVPRILMLFLSVLLINISLSQNVQAIPQYILQWGSYGAGDGQFYNPGSVAVAGDGTIYVADTNNHRIQYFDSNGTYQGQWGEQGTGDGQFNTPTGVAVLDDGTVYVVDLGNHRVQYFDNGGAYQGQWGGQGTGDGKFYQPHGIAVAGSSTVPVSVTVYVVDNNHRIQYFSGTGNYRGQWGSLGSGDGQFSTPYGVAVANDGTVYVGDTFNQRIQYFSSTGSYQGKWGSSGLGDGQFNLPVDLTVVSDGTVYVVDHYNNRIQYFSSTGTYQGQWGIAGEPNLPGSGDGELNAPFGIAIANDGMIYIADNGNHRIQKFTELTNAYLLWTK